MESLVLIVLFVGLGMLLRRLGIFPPETVLVLNLFALYISLPAVILLKAPQLRFTTEALIPVLTAWGALILSALILLIAARLLGWSRSVTGVLLLVVPLGNTSFMGVPVVTAFFGEAGLRHLIMYDQLGTVLIFATYGSLILALYGREGNLRLGTVLRRSLLFPPSLAMIAGLTLMPPDSPPLVTRLLQATAATLTPLVMTAIGCQLRFRLTPGLGAPLGFGLLLKLVVAPLVALLTLRLLGITGLASQVAILEAGMPPMVTAGALAVVAGMDAELSAALVGLGLLLAFGTLPLLYWLL